MNSEDKFHLLVRYNALASSVFLQPFKGSLTGCGAKCSFNFNRSLQQPPPTARHWQCFYEYRERCCAAVRLSHVEALPAFM